MNNYELTIILNANLDTETNKSELEKINQLITNFEGTIDKIDNWGNRKLAYEIKKMNDGYYSFITFSSPETAPKEIEARLRIMESVIRFLIIRKDS